MPQINIRHPGSKTRGAKLCLHWLLVAAAALSALPHELKGQARDQPLKGVRKVTVVVKYNPVEGLPARLSEDRLRTVLELKVRQAGLRILSDEEDRQDPEVNPYLHLIVSVSQLTTADDRPIGFMYTVALSAKISVKVPFNSAYAPLELWSRSYLARNSEDGVAGHIERIVGDLTDSYLNAWLAANPRQ